MAKTRIRLMHNKWYGRLIRRIAGEEKGAVAMEYIVIALLVAAAVVALVMVFGGNLRNMLGKTNSTLVQKTPEGVKAVGDALRTEQQNMNMQNNTALEAGDSLGGDFTDTRDQCIAIQ